MPLLHGISLPFTVSCRPLAKLEQVPARPRAAEVLVDGSTYHVVRARETLDDLVRGETIPESLR